MQLSGLSRSKRFTATPGSVTLLFLPTLPASGDLGRNKENARCLFPSFGDFLGFTSGTVSRYCLFTLLDMGWLTL